MVARTRGKISHEKKEGKHANQAHVSPAAGSRYEWPSKSPSTQGHGDARVEHVAQLAEDDALLVTAQLRQRHRGARAVPLGRVLNR